MTLQINLPTEIEAAVRERAIAAGLDVDAFAASVFQAAIADNQNVAQPVRRQPASYEARLRAWIALHPVRQQPVDDSREAIYAGRGE